MGLEWVSGWGHQQWEIEIGWGGRKGYWRASASGLLPRVVHDWDSKGSGAARTSRRCSEVQRPAQFSPPLDPAGPSYIRSVVLLSDVDACQCETPDSKIDKNAMW